jgi:predicted enzyme related to lactoylglutathione lyase
MTSGLQTVIFPVSDLAKATPLFTALLGSAPVMEEPYYVQFDVDGLTVGLDPHGHRHGQAGPVAYWHVDDVAASVAALVEAGAAVLQEPRDVGGGTLIALVTDADGNVIGLRAPSRS